MRRGARAAIMITAERKRWLIDRLREVAKEIAPAREWPAISLSFARLADELERECMTRDGFARDNTAAADEQPSG